MPSWEADPLFSELFFFLKSVGCSTPPPFHYTQNWCQNPSGLAPLRCSPDERFMNSYYPSCSCLLKDMKSSKEGAFSHFTTPGFFGLSVWGTFPIVHFLFTYWQQCLVFCYLFSAQTFSEINVLREAVKIHELLNIELLWGNQKDRVGRNWPFSSSRLSRWLNISKHVLSFIMDH